MGWESKKMNPHKKMLGPFHFFLPQKKKKKKWPLNKKRLDPLEPIFLLTATKNNVYIFLDPFPPFVLDPSIFFFVERIDIQICFIGI